MDFITYPLNNIDYTAEDAELFHCTRTSGVWAKSSFPLSVTGADNKVTVGKGIAWINNEEFSGKVAALKSAKVIDLGVADSVYPRIDVVAIQFNANNNGTDIIVKKGNPERNPIQPTIERTGAVYELYLASIYRPAGSTTVTASNITDLKMDENVCGLMADSVTRIDTEAINNQIMGLILELNDSINNVKSGADVLLKSGLYPIGSIFVTSLNETPVKYLGGTWEIFDKDFDGFDVISSDVFKKNREVSECKVSIIRSGKTIKLRLYITLAMDISPSDDIKLGKLEFEKIGITELPYTLYNIPQGFAQRDCIFISKLEYTGEVYITDSVHKSINADILFNSGDKFYLEFELNVTDEYMLDEFCNKFYWKRIE